MTKHTITTGQLWGKKWSWAFSHPQINRTLPKSIQQRCQANGSSQLGSLDWIVHGWNTGKDCRMLSGMPWLPSDLIINIHTEARLTERRHRISCAWFNEDLNSTVPNLWGSPVTELPLDRGADSAPSWHWAHRQWLVLNLTRSSQRKSEGSLGSTGASAAQTCKDLRQSGSWILIQNKNSLKRVFPFLFDFCNTGHCLICDIKAERTCSLILVIIFKYFACGSTEISKGTFFSKVWW